MQLRDRDLTWREIDGEAVLLDLTTSTYLTANRTGTLLLRLLTEERSGEELVAALVAEFGIPAHQASADVASFVATLTAHNLLRSEAPAALGAPIDGGRR